MKSFEIRAKALDETHRVRAHNTLFWKTQDLVLRPGEHARFTAINKAGFGTFAVTSHSGFRSSRMHVERGRYT